jgi:hypothetical protein
MLVPCPDDETVNFETCKSLIVLKQLSMCKWKIVRAFYWLIIVDFSLGVWTAERPVFVDIKYPFF